MSEFSHPRYAPFDIDRHAAERSLDEARTRGIGLDLPGVAGVVALLGAAAPGVLPALWRWPGLAPVLGRERAGRGAIAPMTLAPMAKPRAPRAKPAPDPEQAKRALRQLRDEALLRTALRELDAVVDVDATAAEWSRVAANVTAAALFMAESMVEARNGPPMGSSGARCTLTVLGMGKLGGEELNLGSDIDLCLFYETDQGAAGERTLQQHFGRVGSLLLELLSEVTAEGFAFRVDYRLRPEGSRGPVACARAAAERYYAHQGRPWERAAMLRARPIVGDLALGKQLLDTLRPWIFPRHGDPSAPRELAAMLERARREQCRDDARDLKLGRGGIRELEFFVQAQQLMHGGEHLALQTPSTLAALSRLSALGIVSARTQRELDAAWGLLRRIEHRIQVIAPFATHELPRDTARQNALARSLGYLDGAALQNALDEARQHVMAAFESLAAQPGHGTARDDQRFEQLARSVAEGHASPFALADVLGVREPELGLADLRRMARRDDHPLSRVCFARDPRLATRLLAEVHDAPDPDMALGHLAELFERVHPADRYAARLIENPVLARGLIGLLGASERLARTLFARPALLDSVVAGGGAPDVDEIATLLDTTVRLAHREAPEDVELVIGALRRAIQASTFAIGVADLSGEATVEQTTARLTALAESAVRACLSLAADECAQRFGAPGPSGPVDGMAVVALGSLAAHELGHGGDLDLLFVHAADAPTLGGRRGPIGAAEYAVRLAQRTLSLLSVPHEDGPGFVTDTRLRPSGSQGTLVSSLEAFKRYHATQAASWERQALLRARVIAGDPHFGATLQQTIDAIAYEGPPPDVAELRRLRARMELELGREDRGALALKYGRGALVDIEFAVQALQMVHGRDLSVRSPNTRTALLALEARGYLPTAWATDLKAGEKLQRAALLAARLTTLRGTLLPSAPSALTMARRLGYRDRGERTALEGLLADLAISRDAVRRVFRELLTSLERRPSAPA